MEQPVSPGAAEPQPILLSGFGQQSLAGSLNPGWLLQVGGSFGQG